MAKVLLATVLARTVLGGNYQLTKSRWKNMGGICYKIINAIQIASADVGDKW